MVIILKGKSDDEKRSFGALHPFHIGLKADIKNLRNALKYQREKVVVGRHFDFFGTSGRQN